MTTMTANPVKIHLYKWAGKWGPFNVSIPCGECALTSDIIQDTMQTELSGIPTELVTHEWLTEWWKPLKFGGWHAPIVIVDGTLISQGEALNRGMLTQRVVEAHAKNLTLEGNVLFGKQTCPHCIRAKAYLDNAGVEYKYDDVVKNPRALYQMLALVKPIVGAKTPITVPQIWINGKYVGGADQLEKTV